MEEETGEHQAQTCWEFYYKGKQGNGEVLGVGSEDKRGLILRWRRHLCLDAHGNGTAEGERGQNGRTGAPLGRCGQKERRGAPLGRCLCIAQGGSLGRAVRVAD